MLEKMVGDAFGLVESTIQSGRMDLAAALQVSSSSLTLIAGSRVADAAEADRIIRQSLESLKQHVPEVQVKLDALEHAEVRIHALKIPVANQPADMPPMLVGKDLIVVAGTDKENLYLALGENALPVLKRAIDVSRARMGEAVPLAQAALGAAAWVPLFEGAALGASAGYWNAQGLPPPAAPAKLAATLTAVGGQDRTEFTLARIPNGIRVGVEIQPGILRMIGKVMLGVGQGVGGSPWRAVPPPRALEPTPLGQ